MALFAPLTYWHASPEQLAAVCNGCGPGNWKIDLVPDYLLGLDIEEACNIHDWMYYEGISKEEADDTFILNITKLCIAGSSALLGIRLSLAAAFYLAVKRHGKKYFGQVKQ